MCVYIEWLRVGSSVCVCGDLFDLIHSDLWTGITLILYIYKYSKLILSDILALPDNVRAILDLWANSLKGCITVTQWLMTRSVCAILQSTLSLGWHLWGSSHIFPACCWCYATSSSLIFMMFPFCVCLSVCCWYSYS